MGLLRLDVGLLVEFGGFGVLWFGFLFMLLQDWLLGFSCCSLVVGFICWL